MTDLANNASQAPSSAPAPAQDASIAAAVANPNVAPINPGPATIDTTDDFVSDFVNQYGAAFSAQQKAAAGGVDDSWGDESAPSVAPAPTAEELFAKSQQAAQVRDDKGRFVAKAADPAPATVASQEPVQPAAQANPFNAYGLSEADALNAVSLYNQREQIRTAFEATQAKLAAAEREAAEARQVAEMAEIQRTALMRLRQTDPAAFEAYVNSPAFDQQITQEQMAPAQKQFSEEDVARIVESRLTDRFQKMHTEQATRAFFDTAQNSIYNGFDESKYHPFAAKMLRTLTASQLEMDRLQKRVSPTGPLEDSKRLIQTYLAKNSSEFDQMIEAEVQRRLQVKQQPSARVAPVPDRGVTAMPQPSKDFEKFVGSENDEFAAHLANMWQTMNSANAQ